MSIGLGFRVLLRVSVRVIVAVAGFRCFLGLVKGLKVAWRGVESAAGAF